MSVERIPIFFSANVGYYQHLCVALCSLLENNKNHEFDIYVLTDDVESKENEKILLLKKQYKNFDICFKKIEDSDVQNYYMPKGILFDHNSIQAYYRCLIPNLVPKLHKAIYFDCDMIVEGDIEELWTTDLSECYIAGVECLFCKQTGLFRNQLGFVGNDLFINSGVLCMNLDIMRRDNIVEKFIEADKAINIPHTDQDVINCTLKGKIKELDSRFNWTTGNSVESKQNSLSHKPIVISHFTGYAKPWTPQCKCSHESANHYFYYLSKTPYRHFIYRYRIEHFFRYSIKAFVKTIVKKLLPTSFIKFVRLRYQHLLVNNK